MFNAVQLFKQRASKNQSEVARYSRYIFNGHFIVFLTIVIGALLLQYSQMLKHLPQGIDYHLLISLAYSISAIPLLRTFLKPADGVFLLAYEKEMEPYIQRAVIRSTMLRALLWTLLFAVLIPLYWVGHHSLLGIIGAYVFGVLSIYLGLNIRFYAGKLGIESTAISLLLFLMILAGIYLALEGVIYVAITELIMMVLLLILLKNISSKRGFHWQTLIDDEEEQNMRQNKFINMFTDVKGLKDNVRRRRYLDGLLGHSQKNFNHAGMFLYLFKRNFLRSKDAFWLIIRLVLIGAVLIWVINQPIVAAVIGVFVIYIIVLQSSQFYKQQAYQLWPQVWPVDERMVVRGFKQFLWQLSLVVSIIISIVFIIFYPQQFYYIAAFFVIMWWTNRNVMEKLNKKMTLLKD